MNRSQSVAVPLLAMFLVVQTSFARARAEEDSGKAQDSPESYSEALDQLERPSDLFAAFIAAYQADREWFKAQKGIELTPAEFARRHDRVNVSRQSDGRIEVQMGPEAVVEGPQKSVRVISPGRTYMIDAKSLTVVEEFFDR